MDRLARPLTRNQLTGSHGNCRSDMERVESGKSSAGSNRQSLLDKRFSNGSPVADCRKEAFVKGALLLSSMK